LYQSVKICLFSVLQLRFLVLRTHSREEMAFGQKDVSLRPVARRRTVFFSPDGFFPGLSMPCPWDTLTETCHPWQPEPSPSRLPVCFFVRLTLFRLIPAIRSRAPAAFLTIRSWPKPP